MHHTTRAVRLDVTEQRFGAVGDGVADDQPAIQRALDEAADRGGCVLLPAGATFRVGHLRLHDHTTLVIDGTLLQSDDPTTYGYHPERRHDLPGGQYLPYHLAARENLPLVHARHATDVTVRGAGTIQMMGGPDDLVINVAPIGFYRVDGFEVAGLRIRDSHAWTVMLYVTDNGVVHDLDIRSEFRNSDGVCVMNSRDITVVDNRMDVADDGIYVRTEHDSAIHRPDIHWYSTRWPSPSRNIVIRNNHVVSRTRGFAFIPWGVTAPDQNAIEISDVVVADNHLEAMLPVSSWTDDPATGGPYASRAEWQTTAGDYDNHVPIKNVTIVGNTCVSVGRPGAGGRHTDFRHLSRITNLRTDLGYLSWPGTDHCPRDIDDPLPNGSFELGGLAYWSSVGEVRVIDPARLDAIADPAQRGVAERLFVQPLAWGHLAHLSGARGAARLFQGLGLKHAGEPGTPTVYEFSIDVVAGPGGAVVAARHIDLAEAIATTTAPEGESRAVLRIPVRQTMNPVEVGVEVAAGDQRWAVVQRAWLRHLDPVGVDGAAGGSRDHEAGHP